MKNYIRILALVISFLGFPATSQDDCLTTLEALTKKNANTKTFVMGTKKLLKAKNQGTPESRLEIHTIEITPLPHKDRKALDVAESTCLKTQQLNQKTSP